MKNDKEYTEGVAVRGKFFSWLDNYWYHYKWPTIITSFILIVAIVCTVQACTKEEYDITVVYAGRQYLSAEDTDSVRKAIMAVIPESMNEGRKKNINVGMISYNILSKEQMRLWEIRHTQTVIRCTLIGAFI